MMKMKTFNELVAHILEGNRDKLKRIQSEECTIYGDGKLGRRQPGTIISRRAGGVLIECTMEDYNEDTKTWYDTTKPRWFVRRRRNRGGTYECIGWNYWFYPALERKT